MVVVVLVVVVVWQYQTNESTCSSMTLPVLRTGHHDRDDSYYVLISIDLKM